MKITWFIELYIDKNPLLVNVFWNTTVYAHNLMSVIYLNINKQLHDPLVAKKEKCNDDVEKIA